MGMGAGYAIAPLLKKTGVPKDDIDFFEINEAFASQTIASIRTQGLNPAKVNQNGGAIALGHPLGCTGARLSVSGIYHARRTGSRLFVCSACIGTGMGEAVLYEVEY
jgi:acetyl-CoA acetyltransferase